MVLFNYFDDIRRLMLQYIKNGQLRTDCYLERPRDSPGQEL